MVKIISTEDIRREYPEIIASEYSANDYSTSDEQFEKFLEDKSNLKKSYPNKFNSTPIKHAKPKDK